MSNRASIRGRLPVFALALVMGCAEQDGSNAAEPELGTDAPSGEARDERVLTLPIERKSASTIGAGDSLFQLLHEATLEDSAPTNLPAELAALLEQREVTVRTPVSPREWSFGGAPSRFQRYLGVPETRYWYVRPRMPSGSSEPVRILIGGEVAPSWDGKVDAFPGCFVWWEDGQLHGISARVPREVAVDSHCEPAAIFGDFEGEASSEAETSRIESHVRERTLGGVTRAWLDLPAPSTLRIDFSQCPKARLELVPAVADIAWKVHDGVVEVTSGLCRGARFQVTVEAAGTETALYDTVVGTKKLDTWSEPVFLDLTPYAGSAVSLRLKTLAVRDDASFAYSSWGELLLHGESERPQRPHIVLIDIDTLRPDRMSCYGASRATTPWLDRWVPDNAALFQHAISPSSWTLPSTTTMLTGLAVHQHGRLTGRDPLPGPVATVAQMLARNGYETIGSSEGTYLGPSFGLHRGFHSYDNGRMDETARWSRILDRIEQRESPRPLFLFLHTYLVHTPYGDDDRFDDPAHPYQGRLKGKPIAHVDWLDPYLKGEVDFDEREREYILARYDAGIARMDERLGAFIERMESILDGQDYLLVFTSDHGEEFWEHNMVGHGRTLYQEVLEVPMIVRFPRSTDVARTSVRSDPAHLVDIVPTMLEAAGLPVPPFLPGRSLYEVGDEQTPLLAQLGQRAFSVQVGDLKYLRAPLQHTRWTAPNEEFFDLSTDPKEISNSIDAQADLAAELNDLFQLYTERWPVMKSDSDNWVEMSPEDIAILEALGYKVPADD